MAKKASIVVSGALFVSLAWLASGALFEEEKKPERIAASELKKRLDSGEKFLLIDVREPSEIEADGAIAGAIHIPMGELEERMKDIPKDIRLVFY